MCDRGYISVVENSVGEKGDEEEGEGYEDREEGFDEYAKCSRRGEEIGQVCDVGI